MKKHLLLLCSMVALCSLHSKAQTFTVTNLNFAVQHTDVSIIDIDGDGDRDMVISGEDAGTRKLQVFLNNGSGTFTVAASPFTPVTRTTIDWEDVNQDGKIDMIMSGFAQNSNFDSVYTSDGLGNFTRATSIALPQTAPSSGFADLNNDGYTDIYVFGNNNTGKSKIFFNNKAGGFTESAQFNAYDWVDPEVTEVDFDNDGDIDLFVNAGYEAGVNTRFSKMFVNDGNGLFMVRDLGLIAKGNGSAVWGDYNSDGFLDLLLNGDGFLGSGEDNDGVYRLYANNGGVTFSAVTTFQNYRVNSTGDGGRFADWDNDGDLDVIVTGWNGSRQATAIFLNTAGVFTEHPNNAAIPGVSESSIEVADLDNDSDLDLVITGFSGNDFVGGGSAYNANVTVLIKNNVALVNLAPGEPTNLLASGNQALLTLSWNPGTDVTTPVTALSYNLFLLNTTTGKYFYIPLADTTNGRLMLQRTGNMQMNKSWKLKGLPAGDYRWGVQSIDNSFMGSTFARSVFTINADGSLPISLSSFTVKAEGNKAKIQFSTASEQNNDRFEIERSADGRKFDKLSVLKAKGSTTTSTDYMLYDNNPSSGTNYYRLSQFDKDGKTKELGVRAVSFKTPNLPSVITYPNPAKSFVGIRLSNFQGKDLQVVMTDIAGKVVHIEKIAVNNSQGYYQLNPRQKLLKGQYVIRISGENLKESLKVLVD